MGSWKRRSRRIWFLVREDGLRGRVDPQHRAISDDQARLVFQSVVSLPTIETRLSDFAPCKRGHLTCSSAAMNPWNGAGADGSSPAGRANDSCDDRLVPCTTS